MKQAERTTVKPFTLTWFEDSFSFFFVAEWWTPFPPLVSVLCLGFLISRGKQVITIYSISHRGNETLGKPKGKPKTTRKGGVFMTLMNSRVSLLLWFRYPEHRSLIEMCDLLQLCHCLENQIKQLFSTLVQIPAIRKSLWFFSYLTSRLISAGLW